MKKYKIVVSDLHLGSGRLNSDGTLNHLEDFVADRQFAEFLEHYRSGIYLDAHVDLVLNGDILNTIQVDYRGYLSPILTESICAEKLRKVIKGHPQWFQALKDFASTPNHKIVYVVGNHDVEMLWPECKRLFQEAVGHPMEFYDFGYQEDGIHIEHGNQHEVVNRIEPRRIYMTKGLKEPIINLPWGSHFLVNFIIPMKRERPEMDKARPINAYIKWALLNDTWWALKTLIKAIMYFIGTRFSKSIYRTSNLVTTLKIIKELNAGFNLTEQASKLLQNTSGVHTVIFGHTHQAMYRQFEDGKEYLNTGTWNEFIGLSLDNLGKGFRFNYALVDYTLNPRRPRAYLREWKGRWHEDLEGY